VTLLSLERVSKIFGGLKAVNNVSFELESGAILGLIGPNGAGKTTLFNVVTGVYRPDGGRIVFDGKEIGGRSPAAIAALGVARTFQNIRLFRAMTVEENVMVAGHHLHERSLIHAILRTKGHADDERRLLSRAHELLDVLGLRKHANDVADSLPYGSQRRLEIARQIRFLRDEMKVTVLLVEHNMSVVMSVCDRIHVVDHGETIAEGTPQQIQRDPRVLAAYLGQDSDEVAAP
jgi:branched-chain amino acid transport system ATP-binding protein